MDTTRGDAPTRQRRQGGRLLHVLGYHKIGPPAPGGWESWYYIPEPLFERQLRCLAEYGASVIDLATLLRSREDPTALPERAVLLTFDDGCRSMYEVALPWLRRFNFPAVFFVPSDYVGAHTGLFDPDEPDEPLCTWAELQALDRAGVSVQSHCASHRHLSELTPAEQHSELAQSKGALEAGVGTRVAAVAYPYGDCGGDAHQFDTMLRQTGYHLGFVYGRPYGPGPNAWPAPDPFRLRRVPMGPETDVVAALLSGDVVQAVESR